MIFATRVKSSHLFAYAWHIVVVVDAVCVSVQYPALALLQLPYRLRRGGAEENARRGVTLSNKKKKKERKKRRRKERGEL